MSLFGALMGDLDDDPFFGGQMRRMNQMMNSMLRDPFGNMFGGGMFGGPTLMLPGPVGPPSRHNPRHVPNNPNYGPGALTPFGAFPNMRHPFELANVSNGAQFSSMHVTTMTSGPDGRPQIYQASSTTRQGPDGIRETKKTVADSRTGLKKMSIGHHIHDRAHIVEREQNVYSGQHEERQEFINLDEEEAETFDHEWKEKTRGMRRNEAIGYGNGQQRHHAPRDSQRNEMLALPPSTSNNNGRAPPRVASRAKSHYSRPEPRSKAAMIADNYGDERGKKRPVVVEIDSDTEEEPKTKNIRRSSEVEDELTITEVTSESEDEKEPSSKN